jgi:predicted kinase
MGCGKSTLAGQLAFELGLYSFNSDVIRKQLAGLTPETAAPDAFGEGIYSQEMSSATYRQLEKLAEEELASGCSVIIDAAFGTTAERLRFSRLAAERQARFVILHVTCDTEEQRRRLRKRSLLGSSVSDGRAELLDRQSAAFEAPGDSEAAVTLRSDATADNALNQLYERLSKQ